MSFTIYMHTNLLTGKSYVGFTAKTLEKRWQRHVQQARTEVGFYFHDAIRKYGTNCWLHTVLETCADRPAAAKAEQAHESGEGARAIGRKRSVSHKTILLAIKNARMWGGLS